MARTSVNCPHTLILQPPPLDWPPGTPQAEKSSLLPFRAVLPGELCRHPLYFCSLPRTLDRRALLQTDSLPWLRLQCRRGRSPSCPPGTSGSPVLCPASSTHNTCSVKCQLNQWQPPGVECQKKIHLSIFLLNTESTFEKDKSKFNYQICSCAFRYEGQHKMANVHLHRSKITRQRIRLHRQCRTLRPGTYFREGITWYAMLGTCIQAKASGYLPLSRLPGGRVLQLSEDGQSLSCQTLSDVVFTDPPTLLARPPCSLPVSAHREERTEVEPRERGLEEWRGHQNGLAGFSTLHSDLSS